MYLTPTALVFLGLAAQTSGLPSNVRRQHDYTVPPVYSPNPERANAIQEAFQRSWNGYYKYAFPHDSLKPISNSWDDDRLVSSGLAAQTADVELTRFQQRLGRKCSGCAQHCDRDGEQSSNRASVGLDSDGQLRQYDD